LANKSRHLTYSSSIKKKTNLPIYASTEQDLEYTTDPSCTYVGDLRIGKAPGKTKKENKAKVYFAFGDTELKVSVKILKTGQVLSSVFVCL